MGSTKIDILFSLLEKNASVKEVEEFFLQNPKYDLNETHPKEGTTPLFVAVCKRNGQVVEFLLRKGANPNVKNTSIKDGYGRSPIHCYSVSMIQLLLKYNANIN